MYRFKNVENSTPGMNADGPQGLIDMDLEITNADLFICMYWKKIGTKLANEDVAGTEHELNLALEVIINVENLILRFFLRRLMKLKKMMTQEKFLKYQKNCNL